MNYLKGLWLAVALCASTPAWAQTIGVSMAYFDQNFLTIIRQAIDKEAKARGITVQFEDARGDVGRQTDQVLAKLTRGDDYAELPGTQVEVARLVGLFDARAVTALARADASEQRLDALRKAGELKQFRYLHFATHGKANDGRAFDSALMLTRPARLKAGVISSGFGNRSCATEPSAPSGISTPKASTSAKARRAAGTA